MRAHRVLYDAGWPVLLGFPIKLVSYNHSKISKALSRPSSIDHCRYIRSLAVLDFGPSYTESDIVSLAEIFKHSTKLDWLAITEGTKFLSNELLAESMAKLSSLRNLQIRRLKRPCHDALQRVKAPLEVLNLAQLPSHPAPELKPFVTTFASTLNVIRVSYIQIGNLDFQCPHVHILNLYGLDIEFISTRKLTAAFPYLRKLYLCLRGSLTLSTRVAKEYRARNQAQRAIIPWTRLEHVEGTAVVIWALALECRIDSLSILEFDDLVKGERSMFKSLNHDHRPVAMEFELGGLNDDQWNYLEGFIGPDLSWEQLRVSIYSSELEDSLSYYDTDRISELWVKHTIPVTTSFQKC